MTEEILDSIEYIPIEEECAVKKREKGWIEGRVDTDGETSDEDFSWMDDVDPKLLESETYFTFINESRFVMKKGEQAWNCYGNRTNRYLLVNYGFCYEDNLHESFHFDVRIDLNFNPDKPVGVNVILE